MLTQLRIRSGDDSGRTYARRHIDPGETGDGRASGACCCSLCCGFGLLLLCKHRGADLSGDGFDRHHDAVMRNLIGPEGLEAWPRLLRMTQVVPHLYGKAEARPGRKMGHANRLLARGSLAGMTDAEALNGL